MNTKYVCLNHLKFLLKEVHHVKELLSYDRFKEYNLEIFDAILDATKEIADKELYPYYSEMDKEPVTYQNGHISVHPQIGRIIKIAAKNNWIGPWFDYDKGGVQLPLAIYAGIFHILDAANNNVTGYIGLTSGAANLINTFGSHELFDTYIPKMLNGEWMGTMALTEPHAGSSLSDIVTSAKPNIDGSYHIKGQKIFISGGGHQFAENFVHLTLARVDGAPSGTKGISLFVVPDRRLMNDGSLEDNDVFTAGEFSKLGQKGFSTAHLILGENENCKGWLVGELNKGLKYMFQLMNGARISVGLSATSVATAAYYASLQYAEERSQGRPLQSTGIKEIHKEQTKIINHPDVRRMLLRQKSIVEGSLSLLVECCIHKDLLDANKDSAESERHHLLLELLTPIAKTYPSEMGQVSVNTGLQVLGGYGFCMDFPLQQYYRDIRIMSIYEGTTGIQSIDLLARKIPMQNGKGVYLLMKDIKSTIDDARVYVELLDCAEKLEHQVDTIKNVLEHLLAFAMKGDYIKYLADATLFMEMVSTIVIAWQWLKQSVAAKNALLTNKIVFSTGFYESKIHTMKFYFKYELSKVVGLAQILVDKEALTIKELAWMDK